MTTVKTASTTTTLNDLRKYIANNDLKSEAIRLAVKGLDEKMMELLLDTLNNTSIRGNDLEVRRVKYRLRKAELVVTTMMQ